MVLRNLFVFFILTILLFGCRDKKREEQLAGREQTLIEKEKQFAVREADYRSLLQMRDSLLATKDSAIVKYWPQEVAGIWNSKVLCKESNCGDYVVGDQRADVWEFTSDSTGMFTKIVNNNKLVRVFSGSFGSNDIHLQFTTDSTAKKKVDMDVTLNSINTDLIKGTQVINVDNNCTATFSVELVRASNK